MPEISNQHALKLADIALALRDLVAEITVPLVIPPEIATRVERYVDQRICLQCGTNEKIPRGERYTRGLCVNHYNAATKAWNNGEASERMMLENGRIAPAEKGGRKSESPAIWSTPVAELPALEPDKPPTEGEKKAVRDKAREVAGQANEKSAKVKSKPGK